ncbi:MAG: hypothetical protein JWQ48_710 [Conexibacter sp.]|jgi:hypothetical protein|nr:hypothetical protein [Conexibacter sp.]
MTPVFAFSIFGYLGLAVVLLCVVLLLYSTFHPEGRGRPGGYLDGEEPQREDDDERPRD